ncbi:hypothetical protein VI03_18150 [Burkholderia vietnamiensis]|nr:hypothetical protein VI03_18150 [Burkholderia vietnamiensis]
MEVMLFESQAVQRFDNSFGAVCQRGYQGRVGGADVSGIEFGASTPVQSRLGKCSGKEVLDCPPNFWIAWNTLMWRPRDYCCGVY